MPVSCRCDEGSVTAEIAIIIPVVIAVLVTAVASIDVAGRAVAVQDAASVLARASARGDTVSLSSALGQRVESARFDVDGLVCVRVTSSVTIGVVALPVEAESCALP